MSRFRRSALSVEGAEHSVAKVAGLGACMAAEFASDYTVAPKGFVDVLRSLGHWPYDVFNHTGNMFIGVGAGMFASYAATAAQVGISRLRGTTETASPTRMNRVSAAAGVVATAAVSYGFEKLGGSPDMADVWYSLATGALASGLIQVERNLPESPAPMEQLPQSPLTEQPGPQ